MRLGRKPLTGSNPVPSAKIWIKYLNPLVSALDRNRCLLKGQSQPNMENDKIKQVVKKYYGNIAAGGSCCNSCGCSSKNDSERISKSIGYSDQEIKSVADANLGLGCGNPTGMGEIKEGDVVLDLGSGAGFDCFLAAKKVGNSGKV